MKKLLKAILGDIKLGKLDYFRFPERAQTWGGPFNGQEARKEIFLNIVSITGTKAIVETGTYLGTTTEFFAGTGLPVFSVESAPRNYGYAKVRLRKHRNVSLQLGDSRKVLSSLFESELANKQYDRLFFYLDAHWGEDIPLIGEIEIIYKNCDSAIIMIDDFQVPDDSGYFYDNYGDSKVFNLSYLSKPIEQFNLAAYFPKKPSQQETGMKRGSVVLCKPTKVPLLNKVKLLRRYHPK